MRYDNIFSIPNECKLHCALSSSVDDKPLTRRALHPEYAKTESDAQTEAMDVDETETKTEHAAPAAATATPSETEAKE